MSFTVAPGVAFREIGVKGAIRAAQTSAAGFAGLYQWGPVNRVTLITDENDLVDQFGQPNDENATDWFSGAQFLAYSNRLRTVRVQTPGMLNADTTGTGIRIDIEDDYVDQKTGLPSYAFIARYPGALGNSIGVAVATSASEIRTAPPGTFTFTVGSKTVGYTPDATETIDSFFNVGDLLAADGFQFAVAAVDSGNNELTLTRGYSGAETPTTVERVWQYAQQFAGAPDTDRVHIVVVDVDGKITGASGTIAETYENVSTNVGDEFPSGANAYWRTVIENQSRFVWPGGISDLLTINTGDKVENKNLSAGADDAANVGLGDYFTGYDNLANSDDVDLSLLITGDPGAGANKARYVIENVAARRRDAVAFVSPERSDVVNNPNKQVSDIVGAGGFIDNLGVGGKIGSYAVADNNWKYTFDRYNNKFRWIPLNGDIAGLTAQTDRTRAPWFSPAGFSRGIIRNVVKLAWNPDEVDRGELYKLNVNPVSDIRGRGTVLLGDRTLGQAPFNKINVRRLFIVVEQTVTQASKDLLFEFNDEFTRAQFVALVEPFLRRIQGERGIIKFEVVADESVNTPQVVGLSQFVGQIYIQPAESINFIRLDFVNVQSGISFDEVVGNVI